MRSNTAVKRDLSTQPARRIQDSHRHRAPLLSPDLSNALKDLAASQGLPLGTFVAVLINEALTRRLRGGRW
jgi:hypothetical protein